MTIQPVGAIIAFAGKIGPAPNYDGCPKGWLPCDGKSIPAGKPFDALRKLVGDNTPDLQGYFLRGLGGVDPEQGRAVLSVQADGVGSHSHGYDHWFAAGVGKSGSDAPLVAGSNDRPQTTGPTPSPGETRPKNKAVNFIIKAADEG